MPQQLPSVSSTARGKIRINLHKHKPHSLYMYVILTSKYASLLPP